MIDVDTGEEFSILDALDVYMSELIMTPVDGLQTNKKLKGTTYVLNSEEKIQTTKTSSTQQVFWESYKPDFLSGEDVNVEISFEEVVSHYVKVTKVDDLFQVEKSIFEEKTKMAHDATARDKIIYDIDMHHLDRNVKLTSEEKPTMTLLDVSSKHEDSRMSTQQILGKEDLASKSLVQENFGG